MVIDLSVNKSESEMRHAEKEYKRMQYFRDTKADRIPEPRRVANADFGVVPSGKVSLTKGDCDDHIKPETF